MRNFFNRCYDFKQSIVWRIQNAKLIFWLLCLSFAAGLIVGMFLKKPATVSIYYIEYTEIYYFRIFSSTSGMFSIFFSQLINNIYYFGAVYLFSLTIVLLPLNFVAIFYRGFILGTVCVIIFKSYSVNGIILAVLVVAPQNIITTFFLLSAVLAGQDNCRRGRLCAFTLKAMLIEFLILCALSLIGAVYELVFTAFILRPINFLF